MWSASYHAIWRRSAGSSYLWETHPLISKRIKALRAFADCDVWYAWRSDVERPAALQTKADTDARCARILGILSPGEPSGLPATAG
jgi:hypothetical protein